MILGKAKGGIGMLPSKVKIDQFKRELKSLTYYDGRMEELYDELIRLDRIMHEARPQRMGVRSGLPLNYLSLMEEEDQVRQEYDFLNQSKRRIEEKLEKLNNEDRCLLIDLYVKGFSFDKISMQRYMSVRNVKYKVDSIIKTII